MKNPQRWRCTHHHFVAARHPIMKFREGMCKFPLGNLSDPPERFCGESAMVGSPYCPACRRIAYTRTAADKEKTPRRARIAAGPHGMRTGVAAIALTRAT